MKRAVGGRNAVRYDLSAAGELGEMVLRASRKSNCMNGRLWGWGREIDRLGLGSIERGREG